jgi:hypothetical protein
MPGERETRILARVLAFLWPASWTETRRGLLLCIVATFSLAGAIIGLLAGIVLTVAVH